MHRLVTWLLTLLFPTALSAQDVHVTALGDTILTHILAKVESVIAKRAKTTPDTVFLPAPAPTPEPAPAPAPTPAPVPAKLGVAFGVWHLPPASYASTAYTGAYLGYGTVVSASTPAGVLAQIAQAKAAGRRLMLNLVGRKSASTGGPDMTYYLSTLNAWKPYAAQLATYVEDGTVIGTVLADEPNCASCWRGKTWTVAQMQQVATATRELVPNIPRGFRVAPAWLKRLNAPALYAELDFAWLQYEGPLHLPCAKAITTCIDNASAAATSIRLKLVTGMNTLDGGDGSSGIPGTFTNAATVKRWQLSAAEVLQYGLPLVTDPRVCAVLSWRYGTNATKAQINSRMTDQQLADIVSFDTRMRAPLDSVARVAARQPVRSCGKPGVRSPD